MSKHALLPGLLIRLCFNLRFKVEVEAFGLINSRAAVGNQIAQSATHPNRSVYDTLLCLSIFRCHLLESTFADFFLFYR